MAGSGMPGYAYDARGNIQSKTEYAYTTGNLGAAERTVAYGYGDASWSDLLTSIGGQSLTVDEIGNLLSDGTWTYTWQHGRQLAGMSKTGTNIAYGYDSDGKRITKSVNGTTYNYHYLGDQLVELTWGGNKLHFIYDSTGPLSVNCNGTEYFYVKNAQGDVTGLVNASGTRVVTYTYDAWGQPAEHYRLDGEHPRRTEPPALPRIRLRHGDRAVLSAEQVL